MAGLTLSARCLNAPRSVRQNFWPWHTVALIPSYKSLELNRLILQVPLTMTTVEVKDYLECLYGAQVVQVRTQIREPMRRTPRMGRWRRVPRVKIPGHKRAIVSTEYAVPAEVRMHRSLSRLVKNPAALQHHYKSWGPASGGRLGGHLTRSLRLGGWKHPIPKLLAPNGESLDPRLNVAGGLDNARLPPDLSKPFLHSGALFKVRGRASGVPRQPFRPLNPTPWRARFRELLRAGVVHPRGANAGGPTVVQNHPFAHHSRKRPDEAVQENAITRLANPQPSVWRPPH